MISVANRFSALLRPMLAVWLLLAASAAPGETRDPEEHFFDVTFGDFAEELENARDQGKKGILIMFEMDSCPFCYRMKTTVLNQPDVQDFYREHFLIFPLDIEGNVEVVDFQGNSLLQRDFAREEYRVRATPVVAFFDLEGDLVARYRGATRDAQEFKWLGEYVVEGGYKETSFTRYKLERRRAAEGM